MSARSVLQLHRPVRRRLERRQRKTRDAGVRLRVTIVLRYSRGDGSTTLAEVLGCAPATVVRVLQRFSQWGEAALSDGRRYNGEPKVDADLFQALAECVRHSPQDWGWERPTWTQELLVKTLAQATGVEVSRTTVCRMLKELGARWGMARATVRCPWSRRRRNRRLREIRNVIESLGPDEVAYYEDEVDIHLNPKIGRDWMMPRQQKEAVTPGQNKKAYIAGALSPDGKELVFVEWPKKTGELFVTLVWALLRRHRKARRIHLVLDNYSIHSSHFVQHCLQSVGDRVQLHFLPPYSPNENKIERLWRDLHADVTRNHRHTSLDELMTSTRRFLRSHAKRRRALARTALQRADRVAA